MAFDFKKLRNINFNFFTSDLGVDLGTANVLIYVEGQGVVIREPSVVAVDKNSGKILQVGAEARNMMGRTPGNVVAMRPLKDGVISDHEMTVQMLQHLFRKAIKSSIFNPKPRVVICVPSGVTEVEERTVINAAIEAGARRVYLIEEPLAAALGANLPIEEANGHMVVDIGGGTTDIAVLSLNGVANSSSVEAAGDAFDEAIARHVRRKHGVVIGQVTAEEIKMRIGCVFPRPEDISMTVKGRDAKTGLPRQIELFSSEIFEVLRRPARQITDEVLHVLEETSPELVGDIALNGITLTGGGSQIWGMDQLLTERTAIPCRLADDPDSCVVYGCGKSLGWINTMQEGPINLARKRIMRE
ncbi:MAG: rod shape-determining protein [Oscillospiraceae bacterium]|nr:rod shape-determining protein [Oscillospiraceae bacterium]MBQ7098470.1 rod shape-determining protein [Oscillospiraceae bacterium]